MVRNIIDRTAAVVATAQIFNFFFTSSMIAA